MICYEGVGVPADITLLNTKTDIKDGIDPLIVRALEVLKSKNRRASKKGDLIVRACLFLRPAPTAIAALPSAGRELGRQPHNELKPGKRDGVKLQRVPADEAQDPAHGFWRLDAAAAAQEPTQADG